MRGPEFSGAPRKIPAPHRTAGRGRESFSFGPAPCPVRGPVFPGPRFFEIRGPVSSSPCQFPALGPRFFPVPRPGPRLSSVQFAARGAPNFLCLAEVAAPPRPSPPRPSPMTRLCIPSPFFGNSKTAFFLGLSDSPVCFQCTVQYPHSLQYPLRWIVQGRAALLPQC